MGHRRLCISAFSPNTGLEDEKGERHFKQERTRAAISWTEWGPPCSSFSITECKGQAIALRGKLKREAEAPVEMAFNTQANGLVYYFVRDITHCSDVRDQLTFMLEL